MGQWGITLVDGRKDKDKDQRTVLAPNNANNSIEHPHTHISNAT